MQLQVQADLCMYDNIRNKYTCIYIQVLYYIYIRVHNIHHWVLQTALQVQQQHHPPTNTQTMCCLYFMGRKKKNIELYHMCATAVQVQVDLQVFAAQQCPSSFVFSIYIIHTYISITPYELTCALRIL